MFLPISLLIILHDLLYLDDKSYFQCFIHAICPPTVQKQIPRGELECQLLKIGFTVEKMF